MVPGQLRRSRELVFLILTFLPACDQSSADDPPQDGMTYAQPSGSGESGSEPSVQVVINHSPVVTSMSSSAGIVTAGMPVELQAVVSDPDSDSLGLRWQASCPGSFDEDHATPTTFVPDALPADGDTCAFEVTVQDGHGGKATGTLTLSTVSPKIQVADGSGEADVRKTGPW